MLIKSNEKDIEEKDEILNNHLKYSLHLLEKQWFTIGSNTANIDCIEYINNIPVYKCATTCAGLKNCRLKQNSR